MTKPRITFLVILLALVSAGVIWFAFAHDQTVRDAVVKTHGKEWKNTADYTFYAVVRQYGDWPELMLAGAIGLLAAWKIRNREWMRILTAAMIASTLAGIITNTSRLTTGRTRPRESPKLEQGFYGPWHDGHLTIGDSRYNSFPSGHTATAFGFAGVILFASPWLGVGALILATLIAWSSVIIGAHHPSDVTVSAIVSLLVAWFTWQWVQRKGGWAWVAVRRRIRQAAGRDTQSPPVNDGHLL